MLSIAQAAKDRGIALLILIDEIQYFKTKELSALIMTMHKIQQKNLPVALIGAGLPSLPRLAGDSKSYGERLFDFPDVGALSTEDTFKALNNPVKKSGGICTPDALQYIADMTQGYPYFIQEWGYHAWNQAKTSIIDYAVVQATTPIVRE